MSLHKHRSHIVTSGLTRAPHQPFLRATGFDDGALEKSIVGIVSTQGENTPCSMELAPQADRARPGVAAGGTDGTSMNHAGMRMSPTAWIAARCSHHRRGWRKRVVGQCMDRRRRSTRYAQRNRHEIEQNHQPNYHRGIFPEPGSPQAGSGGPENDP